MNSSGQMLSCKKGLRQGWIQVSSHHCINVGNWDWDSYHCFKLGLLLHPLFSRQCLSVQLTGSCKTAYHMDDKKQTLMNHCFIYNSQNLIWLWKQYIWQMLAQNIVRCNKYVPCEILKYLLQPCEAQPCEGKEPLQKSATTISTKSVNDFHYASALMWRLELHIPLLQWINVPCAQISPHEVSSIPVKMGKVNCYHN